MDKLCKIRDLQRAVHQFESAFEKRYGICLNEGMTLCSLSKTGRLCPGELGELLGLTQLNTQNERRRSLDGVWKFKLVKNPSLALTDFFKTSYNVNDWQNINVPGSWELQGFDAPVRTVAKGS
jgi:hypothetical protein